MRKPTASSLRKQSPEAGTQAELGLIAIALRWPELRSEIWSRVSAAESDARPLNLLRDICTSTESQASIEASLSERMDERRRAELSSLMVGSLLDDVEKTHALMEDYIEAILKARQRSEVDTLRRIAATEHGDEAMAAAQAVIALRRGAGERSET
jgi:hypothetical protein